MDRQSRPGKRGKYKRNKESTTRQLTTPPQLPVDRRQFDDSCARSRAKLNADRCGGYDYQFVSNPPDELICSICLSVLRDTNLTDCCGNHFCQLCIWRIKNEGKPCPLCQEKYYNIMLDKSIIRRVKELKIKCPSCGHGCEWVGELGSIERHLDVSCGFVEVTCDYCQSEYILRNSLSHHKSTCPARPYSCEYCGFKDKWELITSVHHGECEKYPVECPNKCGVGKIQRRKVNKHLREECALEVIGCEFEYTGCQVRRPRTHMALHISENMPSHLGTVASHFKKKLADKGKVIDELSMHNKAQSRQLLELREDIQSQKEQITELEANIERRQLSAVSALKAKVQSQEREISRLRGDIQSQIKEQTKELKASVKKERLSALSALKEGEISGLRADVQSQRKHIEDLEAHMESAYSKVLEKVEVEVVDMQSIFYVPIFQLLEDIALKNEDIYLSNFRNTAVRLIFLAVIGAFIGAFIGSFMGAAFCSVTGLKIMGGVYVGAVVWGLSGAKFAVERSKCAARVLSRTDKKEKQHVARTAIQVARERHLHFVEHLLARMILDNPAEARSLLIAVLKKLNFEVEYRRRQ